MKKPTELLGVVLLNEGFYTRLAVERDLRVIEDRFEHEGMSFLTITLPVLSDALEKGLSVGRITPHDFPGFKPWKRGGRLPGLLRGFFMRVFDLDGGLLDSPCIDSIRAIRQVARLFKKVELPCSSARVKRAYERYLSNDQSVYRTDDWCPSSAELLFSVAGYLWADLEDFSGALYCAPGIFGSGATAEGLSLNERLSIRQWPSRSEIFFPSSYHTSYSEDDTDSFAGISFLSEAEELPVRVVQVPKTLKSPRTISVEPSFMMLQQQSVAKPLMDYLESDRFPYRSIRFTDQTVNRDLARRGSIDGSLATIDLSDASDMVGNDLVKRLFQVCPTFLEYIQVSRTRRAQLPGRSSLHELEKFASMGSALCFPIEAMVFFTIALTALVKRSGRRLSTTLLADCAASISVYGDDIIVPAETAPDVMAMLEAFGLKINHDKSFSTGFFRESCGGDYYKGVDVTPTYVRQWDFSGNTREASIVEAYVSLANQLYWKGLWHASQSIRSLLEGNLGSDLLPISAYDEGFLSFASCRVSTGCFRWDPDRSGFSVRAYSSNPSKRADSVQDIRGFILGCFQSDHHLERRRSDRRSLWRDNRSDLSSFQGGLDRESCYLPLRNGSTIPVLQNWRDTLSERLNHLTGSESRDFVSSIKPYALKLKRRWHPSNFGLSY